MGSKCPHLCPITPHPHGDHVQSWSLCFVAWLKGNVCGKLHPDRSSLIYTFRLNPKLREPNSHPGEGRGSPTGAGVSAVNGKVHAINEVDRFTRSPQYTCRWYFPTEVHWVQHCNHHNSAPKRTIGVTFLHEVSWVRARQLVRMGVRFVLAWIAGDKRLIRLSERIGGPGANALG